MAIRHDERRLVVAREETSLPVIAENGQSPESSHLDRDDFRPDRSKIINDDLFHKVRAGVPSGKPHTLFLIPLLSVGSR
jgi:hypothetical protein